MKRGIEHITMMKTANVDGGFIKCVIGIGLQSAFEDEGFVDHIDKLTVHPEYNANDEIPENIDPLTLKPYSESEAPNEPVKESKPNKKKAATANKT